MKTVAEYRQNAEYCREIAKRMPRPEDKEALERMAKAWDAMAAARERRLARDKRKEDRELP
jgi:hypothetical protein